MFGAILLPREWHVFSIIHVSILTDFSHTAMSQMSPREIMTGTPYSAGTFLS